MSYYINQIFKVNSKQSWYQNLEAKVYIQETIVKDEELGDTNICLADGSEVNTEADVKALPGREELTVHKAGEDEEKDGHNIALLT